MCKWGTDVILEVTIPSELSFTGEARQKQVGIDACIAPIVKALNDAGITTRASCCGHGKRPGNIALADGRELIIAADYDAGRLINPDSSRIGPADPPSVIRREEQEST